MEAHFILGEQPTINAELKVVTAGVTYHPELTGRSEADQHPISAITDLQDSLDTLQANINAEALSREDADDALGLRISNVINGTTNIDYDNTISGLDATTVKGAIDELQSNIETEHSDMGDEITRVEGLISDEETRAKGVEGTLSSLTTTDKTDLVSAINEVDSNADTNATNLANHIADKNNPHEVTKAQVGLGNCDNTSDLNKPISTATQTALDGKVSDVKVGTTSVVTNMVANLGTMAGEAKGDYVTMATAQTISGQKVFSEPVVATNNIGFASGTALNNKKILQRTSAGEVSLGNADDSLSMLGSGTRPTYNSNDLALASDLPTAGTGIDITGGVVSVTDPTLVNNGTGTKALAVGKTSQSTAEGGVSVGYGARANSTYGTAVGYEARANNTNTTAIGKGAEATQQRAIAIGSGAEANAQDAIAIKGINNTANTMQVYTYTLLDMATGLIPDARISTNIARTSSVTAIEELIPSSASTTNLLTDTNFVNSSIATNTANFIGTFNSVADLEAYSGTVTNNDYAFVIVTDSLGNTSYDRYKWTVSTTPPSWVFEFTLNNSSFTSNQWAAINSGATTTNIGQIGTNTNDISTINTTIGGYGDIVTHDVSEFATAAQGSLADTAVQPADLATVATSGSYNDLTDTPTIGNATLTIQQNSVSVGTFTANATTNATVDITVPTDTSDLTNNAGYITGITSSDVTTALGYTPYNSTNPSGYISGITSSDVTTALGYTPYDSANPNGYTSNVGTVTSVNNVSPVSGNVTLSIPAEVTETTVTNWGFTKNTGTVTSVNNVSPVSGNVTLSIPAAQVNSDWNAVSGVAQILNKPTIPTVNNATLTITQGGTSKGTFTANASSDVTIALDSGSDNVFWATYGTTTYAEITSAINADKVVACKYNDTVYYLLVVGNTEYDLPHVLVNSDAGQWFSLSVSSNDTWNYNTSSILVNGSSISGVMDVQSRLVSGTNIKTINNTSLLGSGNISISTTPSIDNKSITTNGSSQLQTVGVINSRDSSTAIKTWTGTKNQFDAIVTKDSNTLYNVTDGGIETSLLEVLYPVGSIYITTNASCPLASLISGSTWTLVGSGRVLQGADSGHSAGTTIEAGLPNITGNMPGFPIWGNVGENFGAFSNTASGDNNGAGASGKTQYYVDFDASRSSSIYGNSTTVQPPAYVVNIYRRTA